MSHKRCAAEMDPDYEDLTEQETKRQRRMEEDAKEASILKIKHILRAQFKQEIEYKKSELDLIDQRLNQAQTMLDRLRACIIANYYSKTTQNKYGVAQDVPFIHPTVKKYLGKAPKNFSYDWPKTSTSDAENVSENFVERSNETNAETKKESVETVQPKVGPTNNAVIPVTAKEDGTRASRFKMQRRVIVGNVCKYIPVDKREGNDQATHKWMVYVRGPKEEPNLDQFVKKVWFFLHPSYRPNDLVEISQPPYHLTRRGWGEFPIRVQLHFHDTRNKKVDILHHLKLDRTYTGLQTLGRETVVDIELERESLTSNQEGETVSRSKPTSGSPRVKHKRYGESRSSTPRNTSTPNQPTIGSPISHDPSPIAMIIQPVTPDPSPSTTPFYATEAAKGFVTPTKHNGGGSGWTHLQIKSEPSSPAPQIVQTPPVGSTDEMVVIGGITNFDPIKSEPASPQTPNNRRISMSPGSHVNAPLTPAKSNGSAGWTHLQIKSEPTSPVPGTVGSGWQSITNLTSPPKPGVNSPSTKSQTSPAFKPVTMQIGSIGSKMGGATAGSTSANNANDNEVQTPAAPTINITNSNFRVGDRATSQTIGVGAELSQTVQFQLNPPVIAANTANAQSVPSGEGAVTNSPSKKGAGLMVVQQGVQNVVSPVSPSTLTQGIKPAAVPAKNPGPATPNAPGQSTIYVKCVDNMGKIYLIPQHLLAKSPNTSAGSPPLVRGQGQVFVGSSQLRGQAVTPSSQVKGHGQIVIGASQNLVQSVIQKPGIRPSSQVIVPAVIPGATATPRPVAITTANKASSTGGASQVILQMSPGQSSKVAIPVGPNMVFQMPVSTTPKTASQQGAALKGLVATSGIKGIATGTTVSHSISSQVSSVIENGGKANNENLLIVGGNIVSMPGKQSLVLMTQDGKATSILPSVQSAKTSGAVSLLGSRKIPMPQGAQVKANPIISPGGATSVLQKAVGGSGNKTPGQVLFVHGGPKGQSLLTNKIVSSQRGQSLVSNPRPSGAQSLLTTTVGNQTVILQLLPEQQQGVTTSTANKMGTVVSQSNNGLSAAAKVLSTSTVNSEPAQGTNDLKETEKTIIPKFGQKNCLLKKTDGKEVKSQKEVRRKIFYQDFDLQDYDCFEKLLRTMVQTHPLIAEDVDRNFHYYASSSVEEYLSWNVGKRRACEWQRASAVKKRILRLLGNANSFHGELVWSVKQIMIWCRAHCHTPLDYEISKRLTHEIRPLQSSGIQVNTYNDAEALLQDLQKVSETSRLSRDDEDDEDEIDIVGEDDGGVKVKVKVESPVKTYVKTAQMLPSSKEIEDIQDIASEIGVRLRPVEVDSHSFSTVHGNLTHEVILSAMKSFAEDIVRKAASVIYEENRVVDEISVADVHKAIVAMDTCDFLTNAHLGVPTASVGTPTGFSPN